MRRSEGFNPLHCGAVVASRGAAKGGGAGAACFNPLHCGAVVASRRGPHRDPSDCGVSIPFIAGQWSLPPRRAGRAGRPGRFQSPSLRGSGRFQTAAFPTELAGTFQSPSLRGSGRFHAKGENNMENPMDVSIPFIAGQWSLPSTSASRSATSTAFQSPSLRGSGRFGRLTN